MFIKIAVTKNSEHIVRGQVARVRRMTSSILIRRTSFKVDQDIPPVQARFRENFFEADVLLCFLGHLLRQKALS